MPYHITASSIPERVLLTGDPDRAALFAESLLRQPELLSRSRGFMVYRGLFEGVPVGIVSHGIGGPSALIVAEELNMIGARELVRVGTAGSLMPDLRVGDIIVAKGAGLSCGGGGLSLYYPPGVCPVPSPDPELTLALLSKAVSEGLSPRLALVFSSDSFYAEDESFSGRLRSLGFSAVEMECGPLLSLANLRGLRASCMLVISNVVGHAEPPPNQGVLRESLLAAAKVALKALVSLKP